MKTADLIPLLLHELKIGDQYGLELTKAIESKSKGLIVIKQPTLYTLLKRLEKSRFISSYWQDSEIGGKRHYYKLTDNGKLQLETLPSYQEILDSIVKNNNNLDEESNLILPDVIKSSKVEPKETIIPTEEVFAVNSIDTSTELDLNTSNSNILKTEDVINNEQFATNENVTKFIEKLPNIEPSSTTETFNSTNIIDLDYLTPTSVNDVKFVDYVDIKNNESYKSSHKITNKLWLTSLATSTSLIIVLIMCGLITNITGTSGLYYIFFMSTVLFAMFYPILVSVNFDKIRLKYQQKPYTSKSKLKLIINVIVELLVIITCVITNILIGNNSILLMLHIDNFENFYAPLIITVSYLLDICYASLLLKNQK